MKGKVSELEDEVREVFSVQMSKDFTGLVQVFSGKMMLLVRF